MTKFLQLSCRKKLIEYVIVSFILRLEYHPRLLEEVCPHARTNNVEGLIEIDLGVLAKS